MLQSYDCKMTPSVVLPPETSRHLPVLLLVRAVTVKIDVGLVDGDGAEGVVGDGLAQSGVKDPTDVPLYDTPHE